MFLLIELDGGIITIEGFTVVSLYPVDVTYLFYPYPFSSLHLFKTANKEFSLIFSVCTELTVKSVEILAICLMWDTHILHK